MSETDLALDASASLELLLEKRFGAEGRGLHEKVSSVETQLHDDVIRKLRYIASVRNSVVHRRDKIQDPERFARLTEESLLALSEGFYSTPKDVLNAYSGKTAKTLHPPTKASSISDTPKDATSSAGAEIKSNNDEPELSTADALIYLLAGLVAIYIFGFSFSMFGYYTFHDQHGGSAVGAVITGALGLFVAWKALPTLMRVFATIFKILVSISIIIYTSNLIFDSKLSNDAVTYFKSLMWPIIKFLIPFF